jgi:flavin reductase (DIM6/NTAB) family NADH-FMN oxidoreductase RutF
VLQEVGRCGLTVLAAEHAIVASRFSSAGRPSARHLLEAVPWTRAPASDAIVLDGGLATLDCRLDRIVEAGDHVLALLEVAEVLASREGLPLLRLRGRYVDETGRPPGR